MFRPEGQLCYCLFKVEVLDPEFYSDPSEVAAKIDQGKGEMGLAWAAVIFLPASVHQLIVSLSIIWSQYRPLSGLHTKRYQQRKDDYL